MKNLSKILSGCALSLLFCSCQSIETNLSGETTYHEYVGRQKAWRIDEPGFRPTTISGVEIFQKDRVPSRLYIIIGEISGAGASGWDAMDNAIAKRVREVGGSAFITTNMLARSHDFGNVVGRGGYVAAYLPDDFLTSESAINILQGRKINDVIDVIHWAARNPDGAIVEGKKYSKNDVEDLGHKAEAIIGEILEEFKKQWTLVRVQ
jgi:hypothetical protein